MRLLLINYEMDADSAVLAWQARVAQELARRCELVAVLTGRIGRFEPPPNMRLELREARPLGLPRRFGLAFLLNGQVWRLCRRERIDACFVHMAADWAYFLAPALRLRGIPVLLWYAHGTVSARLRLAHACVTRVVTSTPEGFRLPSRKVHVIGQGIDTALFRPPDGYAEDRREVLTVGRVSRRKRIDLLVATMAELRRMPGAPDLRLRIVGPRLTADDQVHDAELRRQVAELGLAGCVELAGFVPHADIPALYRAAFLHVNVSRTGSMDKTVLEALACGCPVLTSNEAFRELLAPYPELVVADERPAAIAAQIAALYAQRARYAPGDLRALVVGRHDLGAYCDRVLEQITEMCA